MSTKQLNGDLNQRIGDFITLVRERKGITQKELATKLNTTQSGVARMESGKQNFTTRTLMEIGEALNQNIINLNSGSVDLYIRGGKKLNGAIKVNKSKNGAMGLMAASLLNKGVTVLHGIPRIQEVFRIIEVMESIGVSVEWTRRNTLKIQTPQKFSLQNLDEKSASKTRTIIMFIGALAHRLEEFSIPHSSGCDLGKRTIAGHLYALEKLGIKIEVHSNSYKVDSTKKMANKVIMYETGETAVENTLIAAALLPGVTTIKFASSNYMVQDVALLLEEFGVKVEGLGTHTLTVHGVEDIDTDVEHWNSEDPIEAMMFISIALSTQSKLTIERCPIEFLELELEKLEKMNAKIKVGEEYKSQNGFTKLVDLTVYPSDLIALDDKITCGPYPYINMDNLPFFVPIATQAQGTTLIHDWPYENRAIYFMELNKLRADLTLADPHRVYINGKTKLKAADITCPPALRPSAVILIAMLAARGDSILRNIYSIERGYENIARRLNAVGADIEIILN